MKKMLVSIFIALLLFIVLAGKGFAASPPTSASGTLTTTSASFENIRVEGNNTIIELTSTVVYTGTFNGTSTVHGTLIFHAGGTGQQFPPWRANFHDVEVFTGTVNGVEGTVTFNLNGSNDPTGAFKATQTIVSATGDLAGLRGVLRQEGTIGPGGPVGTYTGQIHFAGP
ncbi:MAG TPA: DUF3224 domain-containing protein [Anaerolineales bacterium]|nr:DUF3224 domain-containing protein [Anaerolineales bacterium]